MPKSTATLSAYPGAMSSVPGIPIGLLASDQLNNLIIVTENTPGTSQAMVMPTGTSVPDEMRAIDSAILNGTVYTLYVL